VVAVVVCCMLIEGLCSVGLLVYDMVIYSQPALAERQHTEFHEQIGWINVPDRVVPEMYGPGRTVTINGQGYRNREEFDIEVPPGKLRVVCSGDSFTFGYGVGDEDTWCSVLQQRHPRVEVVNMGQGGYGFDQVYLWYLLDQQEKSLQHQIHLFCIGPNQIVRMRHDRFVGYGKPILKMQADRVVADRVPVPKRAFYIPWLTRNVDLVKSSRTVQLFSRMTSCESSKDKDASLLSVDEAVQITVAALGQLAVEHRARKRQLVVVWLPDPAEYRPTMMDPLRSSILRDLQAAGVPTIDLVQELRKIPETPMRKLFIQPGELDYVGAAGHYTEEGNRFFAEKLQVILRQSPQWGDWWE